jgi:hypothetical protein
MASTPAMPRRFITSGDAPPLHHLGRFAFTRDTYYLYEVEPEDLGPDRDAFAGIMQSASCARARVISWVHASREA